MRIGKSQRRQTSGQLLILVVVSTLLVSVLPTVAGDKRTVVPDSALVIEYDVREDRVLVTLRGLEADRVTSDDAVRIVSLPGNQRAIFSQVRLFRQQIARRHPRSAQIGRALFDTLIAPIWGDLAGKRIIVVRPDDILRELPFQALVSPSGKYLIESLAVLYLPHLDRRLSRGKADGAGQVSGRARLLTVEGIQRREAGWRAIGR
jgi:CHAT domain-containing protein